MSCNSREVLPRNTLYPGFLKSLDNWAAENTTQAVTSLLLTLAYTTLIDSLNIKMILGCLNQNSNQENGFLNLIGNLST